MRRTSGSQRAYGIGQIPRSPRAPQWRGESSAEGAKADSTESKADETKAADANAGGEQGGESKDERTGEAGFTPITSEAELASWKDGIRKNIAADLKKQIKADLLREAETAAAKEAGDYKKLAEDREAELIALNAKIAGYEMDKLRNAVAAKHKLPSDLVDLLVGEDETALEASAVKLAKHIGTRQAAETEAGAGGGGANGSSAGSDKPVPKQRKDGEELSRTTDGRRKVASASPSR